MQRSCERLINSIKAISYRPFFGASHNTASHTIEITDDLYLTENKENYNNLYKPGYADRIKGHATAESTLNYSERRDDVGNTARCAD